MRIKKNILLRIISWSILNCLNKHYKDCMVYSKENYKFDLGVKGLSLLKGPVIKYLMMQSLVQCGIISDFW